MRGPFVVVLLLTSFLSAEWKPRHSPGDLVITNVNVIDTLEGNILRGRTVVIRHGRIKAVAKVGLIDTRGIQVVNAGGKYLIPGFWDMHVHTGDLGKSWDDKALFPLFIANGVTGVRDMSLDQDSLKERQERIERGDIVGPHLVVGPALAKRANAAHFLNISDAGEPLALAAFENADHTALAGHRAIDGLRLSLATSVSGANAGFRQASASGYFVPPHARLEFSMEHLNAELVACSSQEEELKEERSQASANRDLDGYWAVGMKAYETYDPAKAWDRFVQISNNATWQVPALVWTQAAADIDRPTLTRDPRLLYVSPAVRQQWRPEGLLAQVNPQRLLELKAQAARSLELVRSMHRAGVQFLAGTDAPAPYVFPGFSLHDEMELLVKGGLTNLQALQAATFNAALFLVNLDQYGIVQENHVADLVLLNENPLEDIRNTRKIFAVIVDGNLYSRQDLDKMLGRVQELADQE
ncbi:MAG TPA: amidohydrolase family protein [Terriglobales bacterium]|jgi:predicted amidohydrolase YtcJ